MLRDNQHVCELTQTGGESESGGFWVRNRI